MAAALSRQLSQQVVRLFSLLVPVGMLGCVFMSSSDKKRRGLWAMCLLLMVTILPAACGGAVSNPPVSVTNYTLKVTATSGAIEHSTQVTVTVN
jgi:cytochrome bd-type quinol oxidase subunit 2